jgi:hypothetical protein
MVRESQIVGEGARESQSVKAKDKKSARRGARTRESLGARECGSRENSRGGRLVSPRRTGGDVGQASWRSQTKVAQSPRARLQAVRGFQGSLRAGTANL